MPLKIARIFRDFNLRLLLIASLGLGLSVFAWHFSAAELARQSQLQFEQQSDPLINALKLRVQSLSLGLQGARAVPLMVNGEVKPQHFRIYMEQRKLNNDFPGALGFGFIRRVEAKDVNAFLAEQRLSRPEFNLKSFGAHSGAQFIIQYIEPLDVNRKAVGLDIASEAVRKTAALHAMRTGEMTMTGPLQLLQAGKQEAGFLILLPYYLRPLEGTEYISMEDREAALVGWVYAPVLMHQFVAGLSDLAGRRVDFEIYSGANIRPESLIYDDDGHVAKTGTVSVAQRAYSRQVRVELGGQVWTVVVSSNSNFIKDFDRWLPSMVLLLGLLLTALVTGALANAARLKNSAQSLVDTMSLQARQRELQLDAVINSTPDVIITTDQNGLILSSNRAVERLFGYSQSELLGKNVSMLMSDADAARHGQYIEASSKGLGRASVMGKDRELWARHADGHLIPIEINLNRFEMGHLAYLVAQIRDISERLANDAALRAHQRQLAMIVDSAGIGTWDLNVITGDAYFGGIWGEMLGYNTQELIPSISTWRDLVHPDELGLTEDLLNSHLAGLTAIYRCEIRMKTAKNEWKWIYSVGRVYERDEQGHPVKIAGIHVDIDSRKRNELMLLERDRSLAQLQQQLSSVVNSATEICIIATDADGVIEVFNVGAEKMLGYCAAELVNRQSPAILHDAAEMVSRSQAIYAQTGVEVSGFEVFIYFARQGISDTNEWTYICKDGSRITVNLIVTARYDDAGVLVGYLGVATNVTEQKRMNEALAAATKEALLASCAKSDFLANMSHEIRTPMNAVIGFSTLLADTDLNHDQREFVNAIQQSGDALLGLINDILDFSKIEAGHLTLEKIEFDIRYLLEGSLDIVAEKATKQGLDLACIVDPRVPQHLLGDPSRLRQVLLNLLSNAIKFSEHGEVVARLSVLPSDDHAVCALHFSVKDTGIGMSPEVQQSLFRPFKQADSSTTRRFGGTGLGLSICKHLIEAMHGQIGVVSELGSGAEFWFEISLPVVARQAVEVVAPVQLQGRRVLVVDDFAANRELITLQLQVLGMVAACFSSSIEALAAVQQAPQEYVLGLIDMQLPDMNGLQLARALQALDIEHSMPLILLTSMAVPGLAAEARLAGFSAFLTKPIRQTQLVYVIEEALKMQHLPSSEQGLVTAHHLAEQIAASKPYVLLAEDNPINQKVAVLMLEKLGCRVDVANNGLLAIEAVQQHHYDVVMMDCQMPEMDGFTATKTIRALPVAAAAVYIVALTANAFQSDIDHCYAVGMNDFVAKPINLKEISYALQRGLSKSGRLIPLELESHQEDVMTTKIDVNAALQQELQDIERMFAELTQAVGMDMKDELLALFFPTLDECLAGLAQAIAESDVDHIVGFAHKLKGASGQLGATRMAAHSKAIEIAVKLRDMPTVSAEFAALQILGQEISEQLRVV